MKMTPLVSILIPAFNSEKWIGDTLRSAIAQTWTKKEIIVVDDGSRDQTLEIARRFESNGVRIVRQANQGAAAARNTAFNVCQGEYIQWLDADDLLSPDKIARQMAVAEQVENRRTVISCEWGRFLYRHYRATFIPTALWCDLPPAEWLIRKMGQNLHMQTATWLVSRELTEAAGAWDTKLLVDDDGEYFCRVLLQSNGVRFVPDARVYYRASGAGSLSYIGKSKSKQNAQWQSMQLHIHYLRSLDDTPQARASCVSYLQNWLGFFYPERRDLIDQMQEVANELGSKLSMPCLPRKYSWIGSIFGAKIAWKAQLLLPRLKWSLLRFCDKVIFRMAREMRILSRGSLLSDMRLR